VRLVIWKLTENWKLKRGKLLLAVTLPKCLEDSHDRELETKTWETLARGHPSQMLWRFASRKVFRRIATIPTKPTQSKREQNTERNRKQAEVWVI